MTSSWLFFKLHNGFPEHHKTLELSDKAFRQLIEAWCYCSRNLNDGKLSKTQFFRLFSPKSRKEIVAAGFVVSTGSGYEMHDYLVHQESAEDVKIRRDKRIKAGKLGGKAKANNLANASPDAKQTASKRLADIDIDIDIDKKNAVVKLSDADAPDHNEPEERTFIEEPLPTEDIDPTPGYPADFTAFWDVYPRRGGKGAAMTAFTKAKKRAKVTTILDGARRLADDPNLPPDKTLIPMPATWLNQDRWEDDPLPARGGDDAHLTSSEKRIKTNIVRGTQWQSGPTSDDAVFNRKALEA